MLVSMLPTTIALKNKITALAADLVVVIVITLAHLAHTISNRDRK
jgi:hypothetical protein